MTLTLSVSNVTVAFKSLPIKPKVEFQMLFELIAAAKDSWACLICAELSVLKLAALWLECSGCDFAGYY